MKHTKWNYHYPDYNNPNYIAVYGNEIGADICHIHYGKGIRSIKEAEAIAYLITMAPDLLKACKYTIEQLKNVKGKTFPILPILSAIAKAEEK